MKGRPIVHGKKPGRLTPPPEKTCPVCFRKCELVDARRGHETWACPKHGTPDGKAAA